MHALLKLSAVLNLRCAVKAQNGGTKSALPLSTAETVHGQTAITVATLTQLQRLSSTTLRTSLHATRLHALPALRRGAFLEAAGLRHLFALILQRLLGLEARAVLGASGLLARLARQVRDGDVGGWVSAILASPISQVGLHGGRERVLDGALLGLRLFRAGIGPA